VVPAIGSAYAADRNFVTVEMKMQFLGGLVDEDAVGEGWVTQRGNSIVFCAAEVVGGTTGRRIATGTLVYKVLPPA
jgi:acyl-coenzyme A thioesterase PaaI-like protein